MGGCAPYRFQFGTFCEEPGQYECRESVGSQGRTCKRCTAKCYRSGWEKWRVDADNKALVEGARRQTVR